MKLIVAVDENNGIGNRNGLLYHIPRDMEFFKEKTMGKILIMGRSTLESLPGGKPLKGRTTVLLSSTAPESEEYILAKSTEELFEIIKKYDTDDIIVAGGESIYRLLLPLCNEAFVTKIKSSREADSFFPDIENMPDWKLSEESEIFEHKGIKFSFLRYIK